MSSAEKMPYFCPACQAIPSAGFCKLAGCPTSPAVRGDAVAWRVKDFADGWILCHSEAEAKREAESAGNLIQPMFP